MIQLHPVGINSDMETTQRGNDSTRKRIQNYFWGISVFFRNSRKSLKSSELLRDFRIFCIRFPIFLSLFPHFFDTFPLFSKTLKISFCWWVSSNIKSVSSYFWSISSYSKLLNHLFGIRRGVPRAFSDFEVKKQHFLIVEGFALRSIIYQILIITMVCS